MGRGRAGMRQSSVSNPLCWLKSLDRDSLSVLPCEILLGLLLQAGGEEIIGFEGTSVSSASLTSSLTFRDLELAKEIEKEVAASEGCTMELGVLRIQLLTAGHMWRSKGPEMKAATDLAHKIPISQFRVHSPRYIFLSP